MTKTGRKFKPKKISINKIKDAVRDADTADMFGNLMGYDDGFGGKYARIGEQTPAFVSRIKRELQTDEGISRYAHDLRKFGYKPR